LLVADRVRQRLYEEILTGRLLPGAKLFEAEQAQRLDCSRTPVREAFRHLTALGLVQGEPHKGVTVVKLKRETMLDLYEVLAELEAICARLSAARIGKNDRERLRVLPAEAPFHAGNGDESELCAIIHRGCGNSALAEVARTVRYRLLPYWRIVAAHGAVLSSEGLDAQRRMIAAIADGSDVEAGQAMRDYVMASRDAADRVFSS
jgi:DNA-binding GntR family transcriptional regulator